MAHSCVHAYPCHQIYLAGVSSCAARARCGEQQIPPSLDGSMNALYLRQCSWCPSPLGPSEFRRILIPQRTMRRSMRPKPIMPATTGSHSEAFDDELKNISDNAKPAAKHEAPFLSSSFDQWGSMTGRLAGSATVAFLLLQLPQIILNAQNLMSGNKTALFAVPWMGQLTGLLGNLSLLSYFAKKRESGATVVQAVGVISTFVVLLQLTVAGSMPSKAFTATATAVGLGLVLNSLNYQGLLSSTLWKIWEDAITIGGLSVLPQVMWSTFDAVLPPSMTPGIIALVIAVTLVFLQRLEKLPSSAASVVGGLSAWTATLLFMWAPVAQMWTNYLNPSNIQGLSVFTVILAMVGNALLLPRALFTRDIMWFMGSLWGTLVQGWGVLLTMYINKCIGDIVFWVASGALAVWLGMMVWKDVDAYSSPSFLSPLVELVTGTPRQKTKYE